MNNHITYLFGAGASAQVLPVDNGLTKRLEEFLVKSEAFLECSTNKGYLSNLINVHRWLLDEFKKQSSLDVIAKKYKDYPTKLFNIKTLVWFYFSSLAGKEELDGRYESLLVRLTKEDSVKSPVPDNISFLTWNYDLQIEEAYSSLKDVRFSKTPEHLYSLPGIKFLRDDYLMNNSYPKSYQLIHLNGSAGYYYPLDKGGKSFWYNASLDTQEGIDELAYFYAQQLCTNRNISEGIKDSLSFSWEETPLVNEIKAAAIRLAEKITHLYIIGYSLPDLNKGFDYDFFTAMKNLKHVTIQDLGNAERTLKKLNERYPELMQNVTIELDNECKSFYVPEWL